MFWQIIKKYWLIPVVAFLLLFLFMMVWPGTQARAIEKHVAALVSSKISQHGFDGVSVNTHNSGRDVILSGFVYSEKRLALLLDVAQKTTDEGGRLAPRIVSWQGEIRVPDVVVDLNGSELQEIEPQQIEQEVIEELRDELLTATPNSALGTAQSVSSGTDGNIELSAEGKTCQTNLNKLMEDFNIYFASSSAQLLDESVDTLNQITSTLSECPDVKVLIEGHTDSSGIESKNIVLSQQRAERVMAFLQESNLGNTFEAIGYGSSNPIADNSTPEGRTMNRRIQFSVVEN